MPLRNARVQRNVPVAFTASTRFQSSSVVLTSGALCATPALLTRMSTDPAWRGGGLPRSAPPPPAGATPWTPPPLPPPPRGFGAPPPLRTGGRAAAATPPPPASPAVPPAP